jgi:hypothetical protein
VFVAYLAVSWWVLIFELGDDRWFRGDDWRFLSGRDGGDLNDVFRPHDVHPVAVPVLLFRLMFNLFGLEFTPYLILIVTMHLGLVALLRCVIRRAGVGPWIASSAAGALVLFGPGEQNIHWVFQITFVSSMLLGLTQLVLADHDGPVDRRDVIGVAAGVVAVLSSSVGPLMVVAVALAALLRRGWRPAVLHALPPTVAYLAWVVLANPPDYELDRPPIGVVWDWIHGGTVGTVKALGHGRTIGVLLLVMLAAGLVVLARTLPFEDLRRRAAVPVALLACVPLLFVLTSRLRWNFGLGAARSSRYLYIGALLSLPILALAGDALARRWRLATVPVVLVLLAGVPGNAGEFGESIFNAKYFEAQRQMVLGLPRADEARQVPRSVRPLEDQLPGSALTIGWLLDRLDEGELPDPGRPDPEVTARFPLRLGLVPVAEPHRGDCRTETSAIELDLEDGDRFSIRTPVRVATLATEDGDATSRALRLNPTSSGTIEVVLPLLIRVYPAVPGNRFTICL